MVKTVHTPSFAYQVFSRNELSCWQSPSKKERRRRKRKSASVAPRTKPAPVPTRLGVSLVTR